ncbi:MAG: SOS response-associated peptidase [Nitrospirales bacterium]
MCGRFTRKESLQHLAELLGLPTPPPLAPRYNIAPSQLVACVRTNAEAKDREWVELKWGLVPSWAKDPSIGNKLINARGETVSEKPSFRHAFKQQRCLVLADGFYEWKREGKTKQPYYIRLKDQGLFAFAGLWERWEKQDPALESCSLITIHANSLMEPIHHRMPVILPESAYSSWLDPKLHNAVYLSGLLEPFDADKMEDYPVSTIVNNPRNDQPDCVKPLS